MISVVARLHVLIVGSMVRDFIGGIECLGGAGGNVATTLAKLGLDVGLITAVSEDSLGKQLLERVRQTGIRIVATLKPLRALPECHVEVSIDGCARETAWLDNGLTSTFAAAQPDHQLVSLSPLIYLGSCESTFGREVARSLTKAHKLAYSPGPWIEDDLSCFSFVHQRADFLFLNRAECAYLLKTGYISEPRDLISHPEQVVLITCGQSGSRSITAATDIVLPAERVECIDETGAGDAFAAAFLWGSVCGHSQETCVKLGTLLASQVVGEIGAQPDLGLIQQFKAKAYRRGLV